jgi:glycerol uptake facilitator-like aquaporin
MSNADIHGEGHGMWIPVAGPLIGGVLSGLTFTNPLSFTAAL